MLWYINNFSTKALIIQTLSLVIYGEAAAEEADCHWV
jgi:hypothetical protein